MIMAKIVGIKKVDFTSSTGQVKITKYNVTYKDTTQKGIDGLSVGEVSWNEMISGMPPLHKINDEIKVAYNKGGKLVFV